MKEGETLALPVHSIITDILSDNSIINTELFSSVLSGKTDIELVKFLTEAFDLWLKDLLVIPLERAVFSNYPNVDGLLDYFKALSLSHEDAVDLIELITINSHTAPYMCRLENALFNNFNLWAIDKTSRYTYLTLEGDYRVRHFSKHVSAVSIEEHLKTMGEI